MCALGEKEKERRRGERKQKEGEVEGGKRREATGERQGRNSLVLLSESIRHLTRTFHLEPI